MQIKERIKQRWTAWLGWGITIAIIFVIYYELYYLPLIEGTHGIR